MGLRLAGKTALITAAGQGIGRATAELFAAHGAAVIATDINPVTLAELAALDGVTARSLDVLDGAAVAAAAAEIGAVDVLFNCAGFVHHGSILDCDEAAWDFLINIDQIGESVGQDLLNFFNQQRNIDIVTDLASELTIEMYEIQKTAQSKITGKTVVFTGTLIAMGRAEAKALAEKLGARVSSSISQKTDYLVVGDAAGSKAKKAEQLGVSILSEQEWMAMLDEETP